MQLLQLQQNVGQQNFGINMLSSLQSLTITGCAYTYVI